MRDVCCTLHLTPTGAGKQNTSQITIVGAILKPVNRASVIMCGCVWLMLKMLSVGVWSMLKMLSAGGPDLRRGGDCCLPHEAVAS